MTIGGDRRPRLGGYVDVFEGMREFPGAYLKYVQQIHVDNEDRRDNVLTRRRQLVDAATQTMVADKFSLSKI